MLVIQNRRFDKRYVIGGSGILDSLVKIVTSQAVKQAASSAAKEVGKVALNVGKTAAVDAGKKLIERAMKPKPKSGRIESIISKYETKGGDTVAIQDLVKRLNGSGLKRT